MPNIAMASRVGFVDVLRTHKIGISMDGKRCRRDNVFVERLRKTIKYAHVYLHAYESVSNARAKRAVYIDFYNPSSYCPTSLCH